MPSLIESNVMDLHALQLSGVMRINAIDRLDLDRSLPPSDGEGGGDG